MSTYRMLALIKGITIETSELNHAEKLGIRFGLHIGSGSYSHVYKSKFKSAPVGLKICENTGFVKRLVKEELIVLDILKERPHKNIITFLGKFENFDSSRMWIIMKWFNGIDMAQKLMINGCAFEESVAKHYFKQLVEGLRYLHSLPIVHRDIKLDNILVGFDNDFDINDGQQRECIKIIDFGFAKKVELIEDDGSALCNSRLGTEVYMAPELLNYKDNRDYDAFKSDIFSLAVVLFAFLFNEFPERQLLNTNNSFEVESKVMSKPIKFPENSEYKVSESVKQLILNMSCEDSKKRFNINQILDSEWIQSSN